MTQRKNSPNCVTLEPKWHIVRWTIVHRAVDAQDEIEFGGPCGDRTHDLRIKSWASIVPGGNHQCLTVQDLS